MKGFGIYVKNDLLEPKHIQNMDAAVWLYMWVLDKVTTVNENGEGKVLGNKPIQFADVKKELGISRFVYVKWVDRLRKYGYINTLRTPYGLVITVNKAQKGKQRDVPKRNITSKRDVPKLVGDVAKLEPDVPKRNMQYKTNQDKPMTNHTTNVVGADAPTVYGKPEINELFDYWKLSTGLEIQSQLQANRRACSNLLKRYNNSQIRQLIDGVVLAQSDRYAPRIADFRDLQSKLNQLLVWGNSRQSSSTVEFIS